MREVAITYARAHGKGEPKVSRLPFRCEVIFGPQDTKKLTHGKWEGSGEVGVIAGYGLDAGYYGTENISVGH